MTQPTDKHRELAQKLFRSSGNMVRFISESEFVALAAQHLAEFEAELTGWKPIEDAPKDETIIGAYFNQPWAESHRNGRIVKCWWQDEFSSFISGCRQMDMHNGYSFEDGSTSRLHSPEIEDVTHWMPLPEPPEGE